MAERPEACPEWQDAIAGWAVASIAPDREAALDAHLASCATCRAEADSLLAVAAAALALDVPEPVEVPSLASPDPEPLPPALGGRIAGRIRSERRAQLVRRSVVGAVAAAVGVAMVVGSVALSGDDGPGDLDGEQIAFRNVPVGVDAEVVLAADDGGGSVVQLVAEGLDPDVTYALWLTPPGGGYRERIPAGTFRPDSAGDVDVRLRCELDAEQVGRVWASAGHGIVLDTEPADEAGEEPS